MQRKKFDPETYFDSKMIKNKSIRDQGTVIDFTPNNLDFKNNTPEKGIKRIIKDTFKYEDFKIVNQMHIEYIRILKGNSPPSATMDILHKAELTGAEIHINNQLGFIIEERKNSLSVLFKDNKVKVFPKKIWDFILNLDGIEYKFYADALKKNRFIK